MKRSYPIWLPALLVCLCAVGMFAGCSPGSSRPSHPDAKQKYDLAVQYLSQGQPNWAVKEAVDVVTRYPGSREALLSAVVLMDKCEHIGFSDFYMLTGYQLPMSQSIPREQQIDILMKSFQRRGVVPPER